MKIKKVYLENFRGIKNKKVIDFNNQTTLLIGPNGFGKTTIFDVLELCLTGKIHRTKIKDGVTNHSSDYDKPFYQNTKGEKVVIKVWLEKTNPNTNTSEDLIIIKYLPYNHDGRIGETGRRNKPTDFNIIQTFTESPTNFEKSFSASDESTKNLSKEDINNFFELKSESFKLDEVYNLFNYIQQEETTFFLKQSESERKESLGFLFNTMESEKKQKKINRFHNQLREIEQSLEDKINEFNDIDKVEQIYYKQLFPNKNISFDKEDPFEDVATSFLAETKQSYYKELDKIISFINYFSFEEYSKKQTVLFLNRVIDNNNLIEYIILQELLQDTNYDLILTENKLLQNETKLKAFLLKNYISKFEHFKTINNKHSQYNQFLEIDDFDIQINKIKPFINEFMQDKLDEYNLLVETRKQNTDTANELDNMISEIIRLRNELKEKYEKDTHNKLNNSSCLFCGANWDNNEKLEEKFIEKENNLKQLLNNQSTLIIENENVILKNFITPIKEQMKVFMENNALINSHILKTLESLQSEELSFSEFDKYNCKYFIWDTLKSNEELESDLEQLKNKIQQNTLVSNDVYNKLSELKPISFKSTMDKIKDIVSEDELDKFIIKSSHKDRSLEKVNENKQAVKAILNSIKNNFSYDDEKANDSNNYFEIYFASNKKLLHELNKIDLIYKKRYINFIYLQKQSSLLNKLKDRKKRLSDLIINTGKINNSYSEIILSHKKDMADKIKVPFYVYTAKILQNYQQGMGVFLSTKPNSDSIRFFTDPTSNHDAMHHLSSGQLAVVSLAFTLAINKTYNISSNLKFLTIDDPIQEMDSLNIHAFLELIRHEFLDDYQLIFSTHNDFNALYMKYKFDKFIESEVNMINVQSEFFYE